MRTNLLDFYNIVRLRRSRAPQEGHGHCVHSYVVLVILVALKSIYLAYVELCSSASFMTESLFGHTPEVLSQPSVQMVLHEQGVINLLYAIIILLELLLFRDRMALVICMVCGIIVRAHNAFRTNHKRRCYYLLMRAGFALLALLALILL